MTFLLLQDLVPTLLKLLLCFGKTSLPMSFGGGAGSGSFAILFPIPVLANAPTAAAAAAVVDDLCPGGKKTPAAGGVAVLCTMVGDGIRLKLAAYFRI